MLTTAEQQTLDALIGTRQPGYSLPGPFYRDELVYLGLRCGKAGIVVIGVGFHSCWHGEIR